MCSGSTRGLSKDGYDPGAQVQYDCVPAGQWQPRRRVEEIGQCDGGPARHPAVTGNGRQGVCVLGVITRQLVNVYSRPRGEKKKSYIKNSCRRENRGKKSMLRRNVLHTLTWEMKRRTNKLICEKRNRTTTKKKPSRDFFFSCKKSALAAALLAAGIVCGCGDDSDKVLSGARSLGLWKLLRWFFEKGEYLGRLQ